MTCRSGQERFWNQTRLYSFVFLYVCSNFITVSESPRGGGGGYSNCKGGIRLVHGHTKSTLITYFSGMKTDPKYAFLHAFFLICPSCPFQNLSIMTKNTPFFPILHVFAPLNDVRAYSVWSWKTTLITWIFGQAWYPPWHSSAPPGQKEVLTIVEFKFFDIFYFKFQLVSTFSSCSKFCVENWLLCCDLSCKWVTCRSGLEISSSYALFAIFFSSVGCMTVFAARPMYVTWGIWQRPMTGQD